MFYFDELDLTVKRGEEITGTIAMKPNKKNNVRINYYALDYFETMLFTGHSSEPICDASNTN